MKLPVKLIYLGLLFVLLLSSPALALLQSDVKTSDQAYVKAASLIDHKFEEEVWELVFDVADDPVVGFEKSPEIAKKYLVKNKEILRLVELATTLKFKAFGGQHSKKDSGLVAVKGLSLILSTAVDIAVSQKDYNWALRLCYQAQFLASHLTNAGETINYAVATNTYGDFSQRALDCLAKVDKRNLSSYQKKQNLFFAEDSYTLIKMRLLLDMEMLLQKMTTIDTMDELMPESLEDLLKTEKARARLMKDLVDSLRKLIVSSVDRVFLPRDEELNDSYILAMSRWKNIDREIKKTTDELQGKVKAFVLQLQAGQPLTDIEHKLLVESISYTLTTIYWSIIAIVLEKRAVVQSHHRALQLACEIEMWQRVHGSYPESLQEFSFGKKYLDPFSESPLFYRRIQNGFELWSVGIDLKNDQGVSRQKMLDQASEGYDIVFRVQQ